MAIKTDTNYLITILTAKSPNKLENNADKKYRNITQQAHHVESTCNWGEKLVDRVLLQFQVYSTWISSCVLLVLIYTWISSEVWALFFSPVIHVAFLMWIIGVYFQVYSTWIVSRGLMVYPFTWISYGYHVKNATSFCFTYFPRVFFTWIIGVLLCLFKISIRNVQS